MYLLLLFVIFVIMSAISNLKVKSWQIVTVVVHAVLELHLCDCLVNGSLEKYFLLSWKFCTGTKAYESEIQIQVIHM